ncbi:MAG: hypothetical protein R3C49_04850 [Planctomycetaceae bacterium]
MSIRLFLCVFLTVFWLVFMPTTQADETTVALTAVVEQDADEGQIALVNGLLDLLEAELSTQPDVAVVERRRIDLALHELALSADLGRNSESRAQLGKIASADLILTLQLTGPDDAEQQEEQESNAGETSQVVVRIVESQTGIVRGVSVAPIIDERIDQCASQIAAYFRIVRLIRTQTPVTIAVAPFECTGRFERLRPLELGLRDLFTDGLQKWSNVLAEEANKVESPAAAQKTEDAPKTFHVVQRSGMKELLAELDLIQSALTDKSRLPRKLPTRAAAWLLSGEVDESNTDGRFEVIVSGKLINAATDATDMEFRFQCPDKQIPLHLAHQVRLIVAKLTHRDGIVGSEKQREAFETGSLFEATLADLRRFVRRRPADFSLTDFALEGKSSGPMLQADTPLGRAVLRKSIDRLEIISFINPDNLQAKYALAFCLTFHLDGILDLKRADGLLREVSQATSDDDFKAASLQLLAESCFHHSKGRVDANLMDTATEQMTFAMIHVPRKHRMLWDYCRRMLDGDGNLAKAKDRAVLKSLLQFCRENAKGGWTSDLSLLAIDVTQRIDQLDNEGNSQPPDFTAEMQELQKLVASDDPQVRVNVVRRLGARLRYMKKYREAADALLAVADSLTVADNAQSRSTGDNLRMRAARCLIDGEYWSEARTLLESFKVGHPHSLGAGYRAVELAKCLIHDGEKQKAQDLLIDMAENDEGIVDNSEIVNMINELGDVPLREDRDIDVEYVDWPAFEHLDPPPKRNSLHVLASDGHRLIAGGEGLWALDPENRTWTQLTDLFSDVSDIAINDADIWVATKNSGIWAYDSKSAAWGSLSTEDGLPDSRVTSITASPDGIFAGIGERGAGGVVRIGEDHRVHVLAEEYAPRTAPQTLVVHRGELLVTADYLLYRLNLKTGRWKKPEPKTDSYLAVFPGKEHVWASRARRELVPLDMPVEYENHFSNAWFTGQSSSYGVNIILEHADRVWIGGGQWARFATAGLYCIDKHTGQMQKYSFRDGFPSSRLHQVNDGVAIGDDLWFSTSSGLVRVRSRPCPQPEPVSAARQALFLKTASAIDFPKSPVNGDLRIQRKPLPTVAKAANRYKSNAESFLIADHQSVPRAIVTCRLRPDGKLVREVVSVNPTMLSVPDLPGFGTWQPRHGGSGRQTARLQPPTKAESESRLRAMQEIAKSISIIVNNKRESPSTLVQEPLYRYQSVQRYVGDGAIFAFETDGDPDAWLLVWQNSVTETWSWLAAAATSLPLRCYEDSNLVWDKPGYWSKPRPPESPYVEMMLSDHSDLVAKP